MNIETQANCYDLFGGKMSSQKIEKLEKMFLLLPQEKCPVIHRFSPGVCTREVFLPKSTIVIGHHQNFEHMNIFLKGKITFFGEDGPIELTAPMSLLAKPGRKIAYIHEDSVWMNIWATNETDVEKIEQKFLTKSDSWKQDCLERQKIKLLQTRIDQNDFSKAIKEYGWTEEKVWEISSNSKDLIDLPSGFYKFKTGLSAIHGMGIFATGDFIEDEVIAPSRIGDKRTIAGRYTNHSITPNARMVRGPSDDIYLKAIKKITGCMGGQDGEEITIDYREALDLTLAVMGEKCQL